MDVFRLRDKLVGDYQQYVTSFVNIRDGRIRKRVDEELEAGLLWPEPLIQLNPSFEPGGYVDELLGEGLLHAEADRIFRMKEDRGDSGRRMRLHKHQVDAIRAAKTDQSYVLTTGTGSGKSLAYLVPIVDWVLRRGPGRGIQAIVVYPMNALANSQQQELDKFLNWGYPDGRGPVTFARYTGPDDDETRSRILESPPDILLTNYVMLELILTRPYEKKLVKAAKDLRFLVMDELHTYRGRQGADVAMLCRRVKEACAADDLQYVGTSATLSTEGSYEDHRVEVAGVASQIFGVPVTPANVIGETLQRATPPAVLEDAEFVRRLTERVTGREEPSSDYEAFLQDPRSMWIESTIGLEEEDGRLVRQMPRAITGDEGVAKDLAALTGVSEERAVDAITRQLLEGYTAKNPATGFPAFNFRLNQFISRGETVYATIQSPDTRYITTQGQKYAPESDRQNILSPLTFCRECGQEYYMVWLRRDETMSVQYLTSRGRLADRTDEEGGEAGYLYVSDEIPWPLDEGEVQKRLHDDWLEEKGAGWRVKSHYRKLLPRTLNIAPNGKEDASGVEGQFILTPFRFCLSCSVTYSGHQQSDYGKLTTLGSGGRSTSTTILSLAAIRGLRNEPTLSDKAKKLLSFTDNRQDASLQAGHFNDFIQISLLRSALYKAVAEAADEGLTHDVLPLRVFDALDLHLNLFASDPEVKFAAAEQTKKALRNVIGYRLYRDLRRGWRVTSPNLEQSGLLKIDYESLQELCVADEEWGPRHPALATATAGERETVARTLLDWMRRELAIKVRYLDTQDQEQIQAQSSQRLISPWAIDENETLEYATTVLPRSQRQHDPRDLMYLSSRGGFGQYLGRSGTFDNHPDKLTLEDKEKVIRDLLEVLRVAGLVERVREVKDDVPGYQIPASVLRWRVGDGTEAFRDPIRVPRPPQNGLRTNRFFVEYYKTIAEDAKGLEAHEHTAQVPNEIREEREQAFRAGTLPVLYCSPTMELGIDISELNVVNMRNVPPTPANYAQRSGRAGRRGQPALVFAFCTTGSSHDQYFFRRPHLMVSGQVAPPRIDLANDDLIRSHIQAVWLAETDKSLGKSLVQLLDVAGEDPSLALLDDVEGQLDSPQARERSLERGRRLLATIEEHVADAPWYSDGWLEDVVSKAPKVFDAACDRWRGLYRAARSQFKLQNAVVQDASRPQREKDRAKRLRREAEAQMELLTATEGRMMQSDFYSYRYFASEGFLPGYSFPRLPLSAFIPGRRGFKGRDEYLSRPRFLAISEFGPRAFIYHEGSRYQTEKVILSVEEGEGPDASIITRSAKQCARCGYLHPMREEPGPDLCENCKQELPGAMRNLFRLRNVSTRRRERISSDEEERTRMGFDLRTGVRFATHDGQPSTHTAEVRLNDRTLGKLTYGRAATLWRINLGWTRSRRAEKGLAGFLLDVETGRWARSETEDETSSDDPLGSQQERVIPYVEDSRNCLLLEPRVYERDRETMASLMAALKNAIQVEYQLEEGELAAEPLPDDLDRRLILFYESAEGGAGVLHRLIDDPHALNRVASRALDLCHFDPETGNDLRRAPHAREDCEAACYDCLMSYSNQRDHQFLERMRIRDVLIELKGATVDASPGPLPRPEQLQKLMNTSDSELERKWLRFIDEGGFRLPARGNRLLETCNTRPDFFYDDHTAVIFIDGPYHDGKEGEDAAITRCLEDAGYQVIRFHHAADWSAVVAANPHVFGAGS